MPGAETRKLLGHLAVAAAIGLNLLWIPCLPVTFDVLGMSLAVSHGPLAALAATAALVAYSYTFASLMTARSSPRWRFRASVAVVWSSLFLLAQILYWSTSHWDRDDLRHPAWFILMLLMALGPLATLSAVKLRWNQIITPNTCTDCGYDLRGNPQGLTCPECGAPALRSTDRKAPAPPSPPSRRRFRWWFAGSLMLLYLIWVGYATWERHCIRTEMQQMYQALSRGDLSVLQRSATPEFNARGSAKLFGEGDFMMWLHPDANIVFYGFEAETTCHSLFNIVDGDRGTTWVRRKGRWQLQDTWEALD